MTFRTARTRVAAALLLTSALAAFAALPATALVPAFTDVTPTTLPAGETISASGHCEGTIVDLALYPGWVDATTPPSGTPIATSSGSTATDWTGSLVVPADAAPGSYTFTGHCSGKRVDYDYANVEITVLAAAATTTTQAPSTSAPTTTVPTPPAVAPATALPASPTYTG